MTIPAPSPAFDTSWHAHDREARLLGDILRTSRLALLFGDAGSDKTSLLKNGLMPLLHRRATDRIGVPPTRAGGVVVPFPDRRRRSSARASKRRLELIVYFDDWADAPLEALQSSILRAAGKGADATGEAPRRLSATLATLSSQLDAGFIILLDRFEEFLQAPAEREDIARFESELVEAVNQPQLPASFLMSLNDGAHPRLASFRSRIPGFDDFSLTLPRPPGFAPAPLPLPSTPPVQILAPSEAVVIGNLPTLHESVAARAPSPPASVDTTSAATASRTPVGPKIKAPPPVRTPLTTDDVYALIESRLAYTATKTSPSNSRADPARAHGSRVHAPAAPGPSLPSAAEVLPPVATVTSTARLDSVPTPRSLGVTLRAAAGWLVRHLRRKTDPGA